MIVVKIIRRFDTCTYKFEKYFGFFVSTSITPKFVSKNIFETVRWLNSMQAPTCIVSQPNNSIITVNKYKLFFTDITLIELR